MSKEYINIKFELCNIQRWIILCFKISISAYKFKTRNKLKKEYWDNTDGW